MTGCTTAASARHATTTTGERIAFDMCFAPECLQPLGRCACDGGPTPPRLGRDVGYRSADRPGGQAAAA